MLPSHMMLSCLLGAALLAPVSLGAADGHPAEGRGADAHSADGRTVDYRGLRLTVPADWRVVDLDRNPDACLRLDVPTLYLGHAGGQGECGAARAAAPRSDTLHLEPLDGAPPRADIPTVGGEEGDPLPKVRGDSNEIRYALRRAGVMATVSYASTPEAVRGVLTRAARALTPPAAPGPVPVDPVGVAGGGPRTTVQGPFTGEGFDACTAPTQRTMNAWRADSPFGAVGVYIGGRARACAQPQLTAGWVSRQAEAGWHLMPIWVGPQPWNSSSTGLSTDPSEANEQGRAEAEGAAHAAAALGMAEGTVLYNDLENYTDRATWDAPVVAYLTAWTVRLHELGYGAAAYVAASSGAKALSAHYAQAPDAMPDVLWVARWNGVASVADTDMGLPAGMNQWTGGRRAHQFRGDHDATYGDVKLNIDRSWLEVGAPAMKTPAPAKAPKTPKAPGKAPKTSKAPAKNPKAPAKTPKAPAKTPPGILADVLTGTPART
ncbi:glycoside hydrolase domain-containing protein [Streptomyces sp. NPDC059957]|uniref:DUF1906 domain-containing protein n=1 Tax=unclassified Streptomyces TaxID=2593676 RepID=UPI003668B260